MKASFKAQQTHGPMLQHLNDNFFFFFFLSFHNWDAILTYGVQGRPNTSTYKQIKIHLSSNVA